MILTDFMLDGTALKKTIITYLTILNVSVSSLRGSYSSS